MTKLLSTAHGLSLTSDKPNQTPLLVDFTDKSLNHRRKYLRHTKDGLVKSIHNNRKTLSILDTTAGLGHDSFLLASLGHHVTMLERNPHVYALLKDGLERGLANPEVGAICQRMKLVHQNSCEFLQATENRFDVIYCDPMFPESKKSSLPKKSMQILAQVLGHDHDASELVALALTKAPKVVVKRPRLAPQLYPNPSHCYSYKACRFDVYATNIEL